jgi:hypothetical protein
MNIFEYAANQLINKKIKVPNGYLSFSGVMKRVFSWSEKELRARGALQVESTTFFIKEAWFDEDSLNIALSLWSSDTYKDAIHFHFLDLAFNDSGPVEIRKEGLLDRDSIDIFKLS